MFVPHTPAERRAMLDAIGVPDIAELFADIPASLRLERPLALPRPLSEAELLGELQSLAAQNADLDHHPCFRGAGVYDHLIPAAVPQLASRGEFLTAYTPYQAEASQGELQALFEFQSMMAELTGLEVANSSMYDGATALAEALFLATAATGRPEVLLPRTLHPEYREVVATYLAPRGLSWQEVPFNSRTGGMDLEQLSALLGERTAALVIQNPNFLGCVETEAARMIDLAHQAGALVVMVVDPISLALLAPPGELGADLAVGNGQPLGNPPAFGGPHFGFLAARADLVRRLPGRLVGETVDRHGRRGFVLVLQTREQHIRRERATSNICTNQALQALTAAVYLALLGPAGLAKVASACLHKAHYAASRLASLPGFRLAFPEGVFFQEFVLEVPFDPFSLDDELAAAGIIGPLPLYRRLAGEEWKHRMLVCVTEARTRQEIDRLVALMGRGGSCHGS